MNDNVRLAIEVLFFLGAFTAGIFAAGRLVGRVIMKISHLKEQLEQHAAVLDKHVVDNAVVFQRIEAKIHKIELLVNGKHL